MIAARGVLAGSVPGWFNAGWTLPRQAPMDALTPADHPLDAQALAELAQAHALLENPGLAARLTSALGTPLEKGIALMPAGWNQKLQVASLLALEKAAQGAIWSLDNTPGRPASQRWHKLGAAVSGGVGGFFGLAAVMAELPVSTALIMRSIADTARSQGEDLGSEDARRACLEVFAFGGPDSRDDAADSGYFLVRAALARSVADAGRAVAHGVGGQATPALLQLIHAVAARFGVQVSQKVAVQLVPIIGAASGALINTLFIDHYQQMARGHFTVRRLERTHGSEAVRQAWARLDGGDGR